MTFKGHFTIDLSDFELCSDDTLWYLFVFNIFRKCSYSNICVRFHIKHSLTAYRAEHLLQFAVTTRPSKVQNSKVELKLKKKTSFNWSWKVFDCSKCKLWKISLFQNDFCKYLTCTGGFKQQQKGSKSRNFNVARKWCDSIPARRKESNESAWM